MNLVQYRRAIVQAHERFAETVKKAEMELIETLRAAEITFFEDPDEASEHVEKRGRRE